MLDKQLVYKLLKSNLHIKTMQEKINAFALDGWKLVTSSEASDGPYLIFSKVIEVGTGNSKVDEILKHVQKD